MPACALDHLVVAAPSLASGVRFVADALGVEPGPGGAHPRMGTHNRLLHLGEGAFLEVIAVDPAAPHPGRPRWFGLDELAPDAAPRLAAWVARTDDLRAWPRAAVAALGAVETMTRGEREWLITIPADGRPPAGGALPALIEWQRPATTAALALPPSGHALRRLVLRHPAPAGVEAVLGVFGLRQAVEIQPGGAVSLCAEIDTPHGLRRLGG
jgi:hypothetical protein